MSLIFWRKHETVDNESAREVDEQHALPVGLFWNADDSTEAEGVGLGHPLPVQVSNQITVVGKTYAISVEIPGITPADALDANDAMGVAFEMPVPKSGIIQSARFYDKDDEGISKELWLFRRKFTGTANDAAFSVSDTDIPKVEAVIVISTFRDGAAGQVGVADALAISYIAPEGKFYCQVKTTGADNIAVGAMPSVALRILADE